MKKAFYDYPADTWLYYYNPGSSAIGLFKKVNKKRALGIFLEPGVDHWFARFITPDEQLPNYRGEYLKAVKHLFPYKSEIIDVIFTVEKYLKFI